MRWFRSSSTHTILMAAASGSASQSWGEAHINQAIREQQPVRDELEVKWWIGPHGALPRRTGERFCERERHSRAWVRDTLRLLGGTGWGHPAAAGAVPVRSSGGCCHEHGIDRSRAGRVSSKRGAATGDIRSVSGPDALQVRDSTPPSPARSRPPAASFLRSCRRRTAARTCNTPPARSSRAAGGGSSWHLHRVSAWQILTDCRRRQLWRCLRRSVSFGSSRRWSTRVRSAPLTHRVWHTCPGSICVHLASPPD